MSTPIIWTQPDCPLCNRVKAFFQDGGYEERPAAELLSGETPDEDAMVQLAMQNMELPLVQVDGRFVNVRDFLRQLDEAA